MFKKRVLLGTVLSMALCLSACEKGETEVTETVSETVTTASETTVTTVETTTKTTTEVTTEAVDTSGVEYIKEALQAEWDDSVIEVDMCAADLNADGVEELFVTNISMYGHNGIVCVYDVSDGMKKLYEISANTGKKGTGIYNDENGTVHYILRADYNGSRWQENHAYFDITYDSIKMPFYVYVYSWYDNGAHMFDFNIYKNCEVVPTNTVDRNFDPEKAEFIGTYDMMDVRAAFDYDESNEVIEIVQKEVFDGLTYTSDATKIYSGSSDYSYDEDTKKPGVVWNFEEFWQQAAPKLAEVYGN